MARQVLKSWRESASLIVLSKIKNNLPKDKFDYKLLLFSRSQKASFMPNSSVFPGGVCEKADESPLWYKHFENFGYHKEKLKELTQVLGPRSGIFNTKNSNGCLQKDLSLRITAIRETFEEMGIIICRNRETSTDSTSYGHFQEDIDLAYWQHLVHNDPNQFLIMCRELDIMPDLWGLHEWSSWLTPAHKPKRFETAFYLVALNETPKVLLEENEVTNYNWLTPIDYLKASLNKEILLPPPQFYELSRMLNFSELQNLQKFACQRSSKGSTLLLPVQYKCTDGQVALLPGDEMYPDDPNAFNKLIPVASTMKEFRSKVEKLHRTEHEHPNSTIFHITIPAADGHVNPVQ